MEHKTKQIRGKTKGFTLVELMVTLALFFVLASIGLGAYFQYYSFSLINNEVSKVQGLMKNARFKALKNPNGSAFGIHLDPVDREITSFENTYVDGNSGNEVLILEQMEISNLNLQPSVGSTNEILFESRTSKTVNTGSFAISKDDFTYTININSQGAIEGN